MSDTEAVARLIAPDSWRVMDDGLTSLLGKHKGGNIGYDPENFQHKPSMARAQEVIDTLKSLGWLSPEQLATRDAETILRALELAAGWHDEQARKQDGYQKQFNRETEPETKLSHIRSRDKHRDYAKAILALQPAPTGWKLVPEELPAENNKKAVKLALSATVLNWPNYMSSLYRVMIGSVK